ncbi:MAG: hypothetical protein HY907_18180 [Deltaproteobacteria bacterium]|nr:hypothetical protein [Deltaproteobacteria bacterium]
MVRRSASAVSLAALVTGALALVPPPAAARENVSLSFGFGWVSPLADPDIAEGYGGGSTLFVRVHEWFGARLSVDVAQHDFEGALSNVPYPYTNGDIAFGPVFEVTPRDSAVAVRLFAETGAYWSSYVLGLIWTWGLDFGSTFLWRITDYLGAQAELRYHLYNLTSLEDEELLCPRTLRPLGVLDRMDLVFSVVMAM